jgi:outer membrane protein OmpA-like peptidoglycan-associated protein
MSAMGYGLERPIASNASEMGRAQNRRVEIAISPLKQ